MQPSTCSKQSTGGPRRRADRDEGLDQARQLLDDEPADMERANPIEENESIESEPVDDVEDANDPYDRSRCHWT